MFLLYFKKLILEIKDHVYECDLCKTRQEETNESGIHFQITALAVHLNTGK